MTDSLDMSDAVATIYKNLNTRLSEAQKDADPLDIKTLEKCIAASRSSLRELRDHVLSHGFADDREEINFFKKIKPQFTSQLFYFAQLFRMESDLRLLVSGHRNYLEKKLQNIQSFYLRHRGFCYYYFSESTYLDQLYFLRSAQDELKDSYSSFILIDDQFSTCHELIIGKIIGFGLLQESISSEIARIENRLKPRDSSQQFKVTTGLSVAQLACVLRLFFEEKIFLTSNQTESLQFFAAHFSSQKQPEISDLSLRTKYYTIEPSTINSVKDMLIGMINRTKKL